MLYSVVMGFAESNFVLFALTLGFGPVVGGLLGTVPQMVGAVLQRMTPLMVRRLGSHKKWVTLCALVQVISLVPLVVGAAVDDMHLLWILAAMSAYWGSASSANTGFNTMIAEMVPAKIRSRYFSIRTRWVNSMLVLATLAGGFALDLGQQSNALLPIFAVLFAGASLARLTSSWCLWHHIERVPMPTGHRDVPLSELMTRFRRGPGGRVIAYMLVMQLAIQIFTPFLNPYLFDQLGFKSDFTSIALVNSSQIAAKVLFLPIIGQLAVRYGPLRLLWIGGLAVIPLPLLWLVSGSVPYLIVVQLISGACLATYELGVMLILFETIPNSERTSVMSRYSILTQVATVSGSFIGAAILDRTGVQSLAYALLFVVSAVTRLAAVPLLARVKLPAKMPETPPDAQLRIHPASGTMDEPVLETVPPPESASTSAKSSLDLV